MFDFKFEGNLAADAEFHFTPTGKAVTTLRVAHNTRRRNAQGEWSDGPTMWVRVTAWEKLAENTSELRKGDTVIIDARDLTARAYLNEGKAAAQLEATANTVALSMRYTGATSTRGGKTTAGDEDRWSTENLREPEHV